MKVAAPTINVGEVRLTVIARDLGCVALRQTGTEHWCEPCRAKVFPPGKETAWKHVEKGWLR